MTTKRAILDYQLPSTRYQGSKRKIVPWILSVFRELEFDSVLDVFGGTGTVSYALKREGKKVHFNDALRCNAVMAHAIIENNDNTLAKEAVDAIVSMTAPIQDGVVSRNFKNIFYSKRENFWIDTVYSAIENSELNSYQRAIAMYALFQSCLVKRPFNMFHRANYYLRTADVERTFGNKATWDTPFEVHFRKFVQEANSLVFKGLQPCSASNLNASDLRLEDFDVVYLDPPYLRQSIKCETADYHKCYHFLEGLARYHEWENLIEHGSKIRTMSKIENAWGDVSQVSEEYDHLFEFYRNSKIVISYKRFGTPSIDTLIRKLRNHGKSVFTRSMHYKYALNHQNGDAALNREVLIIGA